MASTMPGWKPAFPCCFASSAWQLDDGRVKRSAALLHRAAPAGIVCGLIRRRHIIWGFFVDTGPNL
jgi:hypothetical protein